MQVETQLAKEIMALASSLPDSPAVQSIGKRLMWAAPSLVDSASEQAAAFNKIDLCMAIRKKKACVDHIVALLELLADSQDVDSDDVTSLIETLTDYSDLLESMYEETKEL